MNLDLSDEQAAALLSNLDHIIDNDRCLFSPRIRTLKERTQRKRFDHAVDRAAPESASQSGRYWCRAAALIGNRLAVIVLPPSGAAATGERGIMPDVIAGPQLKSFIERIERLEDEKRALGEDIKEVYTEAKGSGFEPKIMRQIIKIRRMDKEEHDEQETLLDLYKRALSMVPENGPSAEAAE
jgi:uncharacterized protein (UPF0335 family)